MTRGVKVLVGLTLLGLLGLAGALAAVAAFMAALVGGDDDEPTGDCTPPSLSVAAGPVKAGIDTAARAAVRFWGHDDAVTAVAVAGPESRYNPAAENGTSSAKGLWQTMMSLHAAKYRGGDWRDPVANARVAHEIWENAGGWGPWVGYTSGAYKAYLPQARAAVDKVTGSQPVQPVTQNAPEMEGLQPEAVQAAAFVRQKFAFRGTIGGYSPGVGHMKGSKHYQGLAIDVMTPDRTFGDRVAAYFAGPGYHRFGVDNVIYNHRIYNTARGWHAYPEHHNPTLDHEDHVHVDFTKGAADLTAPVGLAACDPAADQVAPGEIVQPIATGFRDNHNWGHDGSMWSHGHTGTDLSTPCGTPVRAANAGTVTIDTSQGWAGRWLVKVATGPHSLTTWYAHMQAVYVTDGATVIAGQRIGDVGALGNATGCHLHFEVHPHNGSIYQDGIDPSGWLAANVGRDLGTPARIRPVAATGPAPTGLGFTIASFNVLGSTHTERGGEHPGMASGPTRMRGAVTLLDKHAIDVVGFQEFQRNQRDAFLRYAGDRYAIWNPPGDTENAIGWRRADWDLAGTRTITIPYFDGHTRRMPVVALRFKRGAQETMWFANWHNPADTRRYPRQGHWRAVATAHERTYLNRLTESGRRVFVTGDMNEHRTYPRALAPEFKAADPGYKGIDWILASDGTRFLDHTVDHSPLVRRSTDHPLVVARVLVGAA